MKQKIRQPGKYSYVPAALNSSNFGGLGLYVRYGKTGSNSITVREANPGVMWIQAPDRDLVFVSDTHHEHSWTPSGGTFDEFLNLSVFHEDAAKDFGLDYYMTNFTEFIGARDRKSLRLREGHKHIEGTPLVISDSGGFQLMTGKLDYVDPVEAVQWYNRNVDIGIVLDIPPVGGTDNKDLLRMAKVQKANTELMLQHKTPELELMNIFHGNTMEGREIFRKVVETDKIDRLAIGGSYNKSILLSIYELMKLATTGKQYKQYHILGVTNFLQVVALLRLTQKGLVPHVTSDSSTHLNKAFKKEYLHQSQLTSNIVHLQIGRKHVYPSVGNRLPCSCPVCSRVKYTDIFSLNDGMALNGALAWHNMHFYSEYITRMKDVVTLPSKDLLHLIQKQLGSRHGVKEAMDAIRFIDCIEEEGLPKAAKKYEFFIEHSVTHQDDNNLFTGVQEEDSHFHDRLNAIMATYETGVKGTDKLAKISLKVKRSQAKRSSTKKKKAKTKKDKKHGHHSSKPQHSGPIEIKR